MNAQEIAINRTKYEKLIVDMAHLQRQLEEIRATDRELKESIIGYYTLIVRWIDGALLDGDPLRAAACLGTIKDSLLGTVKEWQGK